MQGASGFTAGYAGWFRDSFSSPFFHADWPDSFSKELALTNLLSHADENERGAAAVLFAVDRLRRLPVLFVRKP